MKCVKVGSELSRSLHDYGHLYWISYSFDNFQETILMNKAVDKLVSVKAAFKHWRETRTSQGKIPDYLWEQVKELLDTYSLSYPSQPYYHRIYEVEMLQITPQHRLAIGS